MSLHLQPIKILHEFIAAAGIFESDSEMKKWVCIINYDMLLGYLGPYVFFRAELQITSQV
uniref:Uncharacterized protein n=1 Tax=Helianthus annuus TaxID=4232 RepID=A0A251TAR4_HELAN